MAADDEHVRVLTELLEEYAAPHWHAQRRAIKESIRALSAQQPEAVKRTGRCENHKQAGGCPLHNLHCGWPKCDEYEEVESVSPTTGQRHRHLVVSQVKESCQICEGTGLVPRGVLGGKDYCKACAQPQVAVSDAMVERLLDALDEAAEGDDGRALIWQNFRTENARLDVARTALTAALQVKS